MSKCVRVGVVRSEPKPWWIMARMAVLDGFGGGMVLIWVTNTGYVSHLSWCPATLSSICLVFVFTIISCLY